MADRPDRDPVKENIIQNTVLTEGPVDFLDVLERSREELEKLAGGALPDDFLMYCCLFLQHEYFPEQAAPDRAEEFRNAVLYFLDILNGIFERERRELSFDPRRDFATLDPKEAAVSDVRREYRQLLTCLREGYVYAFMRLARVCTPFDTLGHIAGVHHVAMHLARQLRQTDVKIDLGLISGAAIAHDIGKFGCRPEESRRVAYLHYYYTYQFCEQNRLKTIGSVAGNHSVWDLELESLSVESLLLIYADFRVKSVREDGVEKVRFLSLGESYQVILDKLDNVDEAKRERYSKVYAKLSDFEEYLMSIGCDPDLSGSFGKPEERKPFAVMMRAEIIREFKRFAIRTNLDVTYHTSHKTRFIDLLESIRSEKNWGHLRAYLTVLDEYSVNLGQDEKDTILVFLFDMLSHSEGDIRRQAAAIAGKLIANYEIRYAKAIPEGMKTPKIGRRMTETWKDFLHRMLFPGSMVSERQRRWIGYSMKRVFTSLMDNSDMQQKKEVLRVFVNSYKSTLWQELSCFFLLDCLTDIPYGMLSDTQKKLLYRFALHFAKSENGENRTAAMSFFEHLLSSGVPVDEELRAELVKLKVSSGSDPHCIRYLAEKIGVALGDAPDPDLFPDDLAGLYLENQRVEVPWIYKNINLRILKERSVAGLNQSRQYQYASHLLNMLQFTGQIVNKLQAGQDLVDCIPVLSDTQSYEIVLELVRAIELGESSVTRYIPRFLGQIYLLLPEENRRHLLDQFHFLLGSVNDRTVIVTLETLGSILRHLKVMPDMENDGPEREELDRIEGLLSIGLVHHHPEIVEEALYIIGHNIFGNPELSMAQKELYFKDLSRKVITFMNWEEMELYSFYHAAALNHIYRFLSEYMQKSTQIPVRRMHRAAFFPGTFDPFSLGHKAIVREIVQMGFRVYLAIDEFSWSKKTQPYYVRKKIAELSVADLKDVFIFPEEIPVNIASTRDLQRLSGVFGDTEVYIVAGSDVIANASAYRKPAEEGSVHHFPHIIFARNTDGDLRESDVLDRIDGEVLCLRLPAYFENMSSTRIRENVGNGKDIASLVEKAVQNYIYENNLYAMEPMYKRTMKIRPVSTEITAGQLNTISIRLLEDGRTEAEAEFRDIGVTEFYSECGDAALAESLRNELGGRIAVLKSLSGEDADSRDPALEVLNEMLTYCQEAGYSHAVCFRPAEWRERLLLHGFIPFKGNPDCMTVNLRRPVVMLCDTLSFVKEPLSETAAVKKAVWESHKRMQRAVTELYPGELLLSFDSENMNYRMIEKIAEINTFPKVQYTLKKLGNMMCVPFGKTMKSVVVPDCVTKSLNTEKVYSIDSEHFEIREYPQYAPLDIQMRTIRSFEKPVILLDDFYHKGHRMKAIMHCMDKEGMTLSRLIVGVLSGRGRDLAMERDLPVDAVYFVPNMRSWIVESDMYPFIGGDGIESSDARQKGYAALPSINAILPYHVPGYMGGSSMKSFYSMSEVCFENARAIYRALEAEYQKNYGRKLTMERLKEVMAEPRYPDAAFLGEETMQESPSALIDIEMRKLRRQKHLLDGGFIFGE